MAVPRMSRIKNLSRIHRLILVVVFLAFFVEGSLANTPTLSIEEITFQVLAGLEYSLTQVSRDDLSQHSNLLFVKTSKGRFARLEISGLFDGVVYNPDGTEHRQISWRIQNFMTFDLDTGKVSDAGADVFVDFQGSVGNSYTALSGAKFALADETILDSLFGTLVVSAELNKANVFVDGDHKGTISSFTPTFFVRGGTRTVKISKPGYFDEIQTLEIEVGVETNLNVTLHPLPQPDSEWTFRALSQIRFSPVFGDLTGDGKLEVVVSSQIGDIYAIDASGNGLWSYKLTKNAVTAPALGDINGDGLLEIVVVDAGGKLYMITDEGELSWSLQLDDVLTNNVPVLIDLNRDGKLEILVTARNQIIALNDRGDVLWQESLSVPGTNLTVPAVVDFDGDGRLEIVVASRSFIVHEVFVLNDQGQTIQTYQLDQTPDSSINSLPTVGDIDGDGVPEILIVTRVSSNSRMVLALSYPEGTLWATELTDIGPITMQPALGDLDGDGRLEIVVVSLGYWIAVLDAEGKLLWRYRTNAGISGSASLVDLDGDERLEVLVGSTDDNFYAFNAEGEPLWIFRTEGTIRNSPAVGDLDGNGKFEIVFGSDDNIVYALEAEGKGRVAWSGLGGNPRHTGSTQDALAYGEALTQGPRAAALWTLGRSLSAGEIPPVAGFSFSPIKPQTRDVIRFDPSASQDSNGTLVEFHWDFGDGTASDEKNPSHRYAEKGVYQVTLTVTDDDGITATTTQELQVSNTPPEAKFTFTPRTPTELSVIRFVDQSSDPDGSISSWEWDFGDNNHASGKEVRHRYRQMGSYTVQLTISDDDGDTATATQTVTLQALLPVEEQAILRITPVRLNFQAEVNGPNPAPSLITLAIEGINLQHWKATTDANWIILGAAAGMLSGGRSIDLRVFVDIGGLEAGSHTGVIEIEAPGAQGSPLQIAVSLILNAPE